MLSPLQPVHTPWGIFYPESAEGSSPSNIRTAVASHQCSRAEELRKASREVLQPFPFFQILNQTGSFSSSSRKVSPLCFHGIKAIEDKILKDSKIQMSKSSLGNILSETPVANSGCLMTGICISIYYIIWLWWIGTEKLVARSSTIPVHSSGRPLH